MHENPLYAQLPTRPPALGPGSTLPPCPLLSAYSPPHLRPVVACLTPQCRAAPCLGSGAQLAGRHSRRSCLGQGPFVPDPDLLDVGNKWALGLLVCRCCPNRGWGLQIYLWHGLRLWAGWLGAGLRGPGKQSEISAFSAGGPSLGPGTSAPRPGLRHGPHPPPPPRASVAPLSGSVCPCPGPTSPIPGQCWVPEAPRADGGPAVQYATPSAPHALCLPAMTPFNSGSSISSSKTELKLTAFSETVC